MKKVFSLLLFLHLFVNSYTQCDSVQNNFGCSIKESCLHRLDRLTKDKPFLNELKHYPYAVYDNTFWIVCIKKDAYYETYQGMNGADVFLKKRITRCKQIDDVFDLLDNNTFVIEPVSCKSEHSISSTCFIISDKSSRIPDITWSSNFQYKDEEYINNIISSFWSVILDENITKLIF